MDSWRSTEDEKRHPEFKLSKRERELIDLAARGFTDKAISKELGISFSTVGTYWGRVRSKLGPSSRTELVSTYLQQIAEDAILEIRRENDRLQAEVKRSIAAETHIQATLSVYQGIFDSAPDAILLVNQHGTIQLANSEAEAIFGYEPSEMSGQHIEMLVPERHRQIHESHRGEYSAHPTKRKMGEHLATTALRKNGTEFLMATALSTIPHADGFLIICNVRTLVPEFQLRMNDENGVRLRDDLVERNTTK